jgi:hypothetical protein
VLDTPFRGYDPALGRFHQPDAITDLLPGISSFAFAFNNPVYFNDPSGLVGEDGPDQKLDGCEGCERNAYGTYFEKEPSAGSGEAAKPANTDSGFPNTNAGNENATLTGAAAQGAVNQGGGGNASQQWGAKVSLVSGGFSDSFNKNAKDGISAKFAVSGLREGEADGIQVIQLDFYSPINEAGIK